MRRNLRTAFTLCSWGRSFNDNWWVS